jgi:multidrug resistance efflux pump
MFVGTTHARLPKLRSGLEVLSWSGEDRLARSYVRDKRTQEVFELGDEAAFVCRKLDGQTDFREIGRLYEEKFDRPLSNDDLEIFIGQLARDGLLEGWRKEDQPPSFAEALDLGSVVPWVRFPIGRGDRFLAGLARRLSWVFSRPFHLLASATILWALSLLVTNWREFLLGLSNLLGSPLSLLLFVAVSILLIRGPRSLVHGVMCKRYGRQVPEVGISLLYYVLPSFYCDWHDVVWLRDKAKRSWAIFAGIYYQALLWSVATIAWSITQPGTVFNSLWLALALVSGIGLVLFNANPLSKLDGYLLLVNWLEIPRLQERALEAFGAWGTGRIPPEIYTERERKWLKLYGLLCFTFTVALIFVVFWRLWAVLTEMYGGIGAMTAIALVFFAVHKPVTQTVARRRSVRWLFSKDGGRLRWSVRLGILALVVALGFIQYPYEASGPFRLLPAESYKIRTEVEGMIDEVLVHEGQWVEAGDPVLRLIERKYETRVLSALSQLDEAQAKLNLLKKGATPEEIRTAQAAVETAAAQLAWSHARAERFRDLYEEELISAQEWENARQAAVVDERELDEAKAFLALTQEEAQEEAVAALQAEVNSLQAIVDNYRGDVERTTVSTPISGRIVTPRVKELEGHYVKPGQREVTIDVEDSRMMYAEVLIPEEDIGSIDRGARVRLVSWAYHEEMFYGEVVEIAPVATVSADLVVEGSDVTVGDPDSKVVRVMTEIPNPDDRLKSEMTGYAKIATEDRPLWDVLLRPIYRWFKVEFWSWIP